MSRRDNINLKIGNPNYCKSSQSIEVGGVGHSRQKLQKWWKNQLHSYSRAFGANAQVKNYQFTLFSIIFTIFALKIEKIEIWPHQFCNPSYATGKN
jgi:hypothetical protein